MSGKNMEKHKLGHTQIRFIFLIPLLVVQAVEWVFLFTGGILTAIMPWFAGIRSLSPSIEICFLLTLIVSGLLILSVTGVAMRKHWWLISASAYTGFSLAISFMGLAARQTVHWIGAALGVLMVGILLLIVRLQWRRRVCRQGASLIILFLLNTMIGASLPNVFLDPSIEDTYEHTCLTIYGLGSQSVVAPLIEVRPFQSPRSFVGYSDWAFHGDGQAIPADASQGALAFYMRADAFEGVLVEGYWTVCHEAKLTGKARVTVIVSTAATAHSFSTLGLPYWELNHRAYGANGEKNVQVTQHLPIQEAAEIIASGVAIDLKVADAAKLSQAGKQLGNAAAQITKKALRDMLQKQIRDNVADWAMDSGKHALEQLFDKGTVYDTVVLDEEITINRGDNYCFTGGVWGKVACSGAATATIFGVSLVKVIITETGHSGLRVVDIYPPKDSDYVFGDTQIKVVFNGPILHDSFEIASKDREGYALWGFQLMEVGKYAVPLHPVSWIETPSGNTYIAVFTPAVRLVAGTTYEAIVWSRVCGVDGTPVDNIPESGLKWRFKIASTGFRMRCISPKGATNKDEGVVLEEGNPSEFEFKLTSTTPDWEKELEFDWTLFAIQTDSYAGFIDKSQARGFFGTEFVPSTVVPSYPDGTTVKLTLTAKHGTPPGKWQIDVMAWTYEGAKQVSQTVSIYVTIHPKPDIIVKDISFTPSTAIVGETVIITVTVENIGTADAEGVGHSSFDIYDGTELIASPRAGAGQGPLEPGKTLTNMVWAGAFTTAGKHTIKVVVDPENKVQESDETNNETTATIDITMLPCPDLQWGYACINYCSTLIPSEQLEPKIGDDLTIIGAYKNAGNEASGPFMLLWEIELDGNLIRWGIFEGSWLFPGDEKEFSIETGLKIQEGTYIVTLTLDWGNSVEECADTGEDNNIYTTELEMEEQPYFQTRGFGGLKRPLLPKCWALLTGTVHVVKAHSGGYVLNIGVITRKKREGGFILRQLFFYTAINIRITFPLALVISIVLPLIS